jgi:acetyl esterase/lipase
VVQAALAKTTKVLLNLKMMTSEEITETLKVNFFEYEAWCNKRKVEGFKSQWRKNYIPKLSSKFWQNIFKYMLNKEIVFEDMELFIAYPNKDCIRDYWNMAETYASKVSRRLLYGPIGFKKQIFLKPNILDDHLKSKIKLTLDVTGDPLKVYHLIDTKWKFLGKKKTAKLTPSEMFPKDLYFDNDKEDRISINILNSCDFGFFDIVSEYTKSHSIEVATKKYLASTPYERDGISPDDKSTKKRKKQVGKVGWMLGKMAGLVNIFGSTPSKDQKESSSSEEESEEDNHQRYRGFVDDDTDQDSEYSQSSSSQKSSHAEDKMDMDKINHEDDIVKKLSAFKEQIELSQKAQKSDDSPDPMAFRTKYEQSVLEIQNRVAKNFDGELEKDNTPVMDFKFTMSDSKSVKSSNLEKFRSISPMPKQDNMSERDTGENPKSKETETAIPSQIIANMTPDKTDPKEIFKKIIIHIHGGGFMAMSSTYHETYLRFFANETQRPLFSIDYRLAPIAKFPGPLHDCIRGYFWIKQFVEEVIGTTLESIILIGDSSGGNLSFALTYWLIENNMRPPDLLVSCYSALRLELDNYSPSFFTSLDDYFLSYAGLWACVKQYLPEETTDYRDQYISPMYGKPELLRKMPKTRFFVCMDDPLQDDQMRLAVMMKNEGVDVKITAFRHFIHGMLSLNRNECLPVKIFQDEVLQSMKDHLKPLSSTDSAISGQEVPEPVHERPKTTELKPK